MSALPTRRDESWRWSDLRAAVDGEVALSEGPGHIIERLAAPLGRRRRLTVPEGMHETMVVHLESSGVSAESVEVDVAAGGTLTRLLLQTGAGVPLSYLRVRLAEGASFRQFVLAEGARLARIETAVDLVGAGASAELAAVYLAGPGAHVDLTSSILHSAPQSRTTQIVRGVARGGGRGVFQGLIEVGPGATGVDARQRHDALLLEDGAEVLAKPELRIYCDDVQCAHGNTVGALDADALFYIRQRGVDEAAARALLVEAFLAEAVPAWMDDAMRGKVLAQIRSWLGAAP